MKYSYDLLLNFQDKNKLIEFFEWKDDDTFDHVKRIPLFLVPSVDMNHFCFSDIKVDQDFLKLIKGKTVLYKKNKTILYSCLFCDLNRVIGIEFSSNGEIISKSCLLLDEEEEVMDQCQLLEKTKIGYKVLRHDYKVSFLTRDEEFQKNYLYHEFLSLYQNKDYEKLDYLYSELFGEDSSSISDKYSKLLYELENHYDFRFSSLYQVVQLSYSKK